jgi:hypothetical protein
MGDLGRMQKIVPNLEEGPASGKMGNLVAKYSFSYPVSVVTPQIVFHIQVIYFSALGFVRPN